MTIYHITNTTTNESFDQDIDRPLRPAHLLPVPYFSQEDAGATANNNDCGAAAGLMVLRAYDKTNQMNVDQFYKEANPVGHSDPLWVGQIQKALSSHWVSTDYKVAFDETMLFTYLRQRKPVIALIKYATLVDKGLTQFTNFRNAHYVVIIGMDAGFVYINDPYAQGNKGEARAIPVDIFWKAWKEAIQDSNPDRAGIIPTLGIGEVAIVIPGALYKIRITCNAQNIRSGPGENFVPPVDLVMKNTILSVYEEKGQWGRITKDRWIFLGAPYNTKVT